MHMRCYDEEFIELSHQTGLEYDRLIKINNPERKSKSMMEHEHAWSSISIVVIDLTIKNSRKQNFSSVNNEDEKKCVAYGRQ